MNRHRLSDLLLLPQEPQREQLSALLENIYAEFVSAVSGARGKTAEEVGAMLDEGIYGAFAGQESVLVLTMPLPEGFLQVFCRPSSHAMAVSAWLAAAVPDCLRHRAGHMGLVCRLIGSNKHLKLRWSTP